MSTPVPPAAPGRTDEPMILWKRVLEARTLVTTQRHVPIRGPSIASAELLAALEAYAASLTNHGRPIPYALRDELNIRRRTRNE